jgi:hypothetical protein
MRTPWQETATQAAPKSVQLTTRTATGCDCCTQVNVVYMRAKAMQTSQCSLIGMLCCACCACFACFVVINSLCRLLILWPTVLRVILGRCNAQHQFPD